MTRYTVVGHTKSRTMRVLWMLEEIGQPYDLRPELPRSEAVRALNPLGKVPVLIEGDAVLTDSTAILTYLADKHHALTFPAGTIDRARQDGRTQFVLDEMDAVLWTAARHSFVLPEEHRVPEVKPSLKWEFERSVRAFETLLGQGPFLMGEVMTIADIIAAHCGGWAIGAKFPVESPGFRDYIDRMRARPAFARASAAGS
ncbi:glutathione S-transferase family protein [Palleronia sp. KMU-117]|uniref:glutathione S-transferase family protein n=1 Tax=Palleronia sp. KMU-117 TaxID=3434108 RepID=UPI003D72339C